jgi:hypothetical protein
VARTCTICSHPKLVNIDRQLLRGDMLNGIAHRFHVTPDAVGRHRRHMRTAMLKARAAGKKYELVYSLERLPLCRTSPLGLWRSVRALQGMRIREVPPVVALAVQVNLAIRTAMLGGKISIPTALAIVDHHVTETAPRALLHFREAIEFGVEGRHEHFAGRLGEQIVDGGVTRQHHGIMSQGLRQKTD